MNCQQVAGNGWITQWWDWKRALPLTLMANFSLFFFVTGFLSKPITVNLASPLNIIGSGSNPACFDILFALSLKALPYSVSDEEKRAG